MNPNFGRFIAAYLAAITILGGWLLGAYAIAFVVAFALLLVLGALAGRWLEPHITAALSRGDSHVRAGVESLELWRARKRHPAGKRQHAPRRLG